MRLKYSYFSVFFLFFLFSGCSSKDFYYKNYKSHISKEKNILTPDMRVSDGVITKIKVLGTSKKVLGFGNIKYSYYMESFLDDGRVVKSRFKSTEAFFVGDRIRLLSKGKKLDKVVLIYRN